MEQVFEVRSYALSVIGVAEVLLLLAGMAVAFYFGRRSERREHEWQEMVDARLANLEQSAEFLVVNETARLVHERVWLPVLPMDPDDVGELEATRVDRPPGAELPAPERRLG